MIYAYDQYTPLPVQSIYDTQMMLASVGAAKDMYEKGLQEMKDFKNEYGKFLSPIAKDMEWYDKNVTGKVRDAINTMYANGIDPIRSAEGRAALSRIINSIDPAAVNFRKQRAANALAMQKNIDELKAKNLYNKAFSKSLGEDPNDWAEDFIGTTSATPYMDYEQKYGHLFDKMGFEYDEAESKKHPGMIVMTKNKDRMRNILSSNRQDLANDRQYQYDLNNIAAQIAAANPTMSPQDVVKQATTALENEIIERNYKGGMQIEQDPVYMENVRYSHDRTLANIRANGGDGPHYYQQDNIFRSAERLANNAPKYTVGGHVQYEPSEQYYQQIDPVVRASMTLSKDEVSGEIKPAYTFKGYNLTAPGSLYYVRPDGKLVRGSLPKNIEKGSDYTFLGDGNMRAYINGFDAYGRPNYMYLISGQLTDKDGNFVVRNAGGYKDDVTWIPVKERDMNYGQTQKKK